MGCKMVSNNGVYTVYYDKNARGNRKFKIVHNKDTSIHTHRYGKKESVDLSNFAKHENLPRDADIDYLTSLERLAINQKFRYDINKLIRTKVDKKVGNRKHYHNNPVGYCY